LEWVKVIAFGETAERLAATVRKGDRVYAEGALKVERWTDKESTARTALSISVFKVEKIGASAIGRNRAKHQPRPASEGQSEYADEDTFA
jgi:single-stranded DNA-binding protein